MDMFFRRLVPAASILFVLSVGCATTKASQGGSGGDGKKKTTERCYTEPVIGSNVPKKICEKVPVEGEDS